MLAGRLVGEAAALVKNRLRAAHHDLGTVQYQSIKKDEALAQVILSVRGAQAARTRSHDGNRLALEGLIRWTKGPVDGVFENTGNLAWSRPESWQ